MIWYWNITISSAKEAAWNELIDAGLLPNAVLSQAGDVRANALKSSEMEPIVDPEGDILIESYWEDGEAAKEFCALYGGSLSPMEEQDWVALAAESEESKSLFIGEHLLITTSNDADTLAQLRADHPERHVLSFPAEMAFGTGEHETSSGCLELLEAFVKAKDGQLWTLCDIGCGTGILAMMGLMLGAHHAISFDYDAKAVEIAARNIERNMPEAAERIRLFQADIFEWKPQPEDRSDLVLANLFSSILEQSFPTFKAALHPGGTLIISGILQEQAPACIEAAEQEGFQLITLLTRGQWCSAQLQAPA